MTPRRAGSTATPIYGSRRNGDGERPGSDAAPAGVGDFVAGAGAEDQTAARVPAELRLFREVADALGVPTAITNARGDLVYYNRSAEHILGQPLTRPLRHAEWAELWSPTNLQGAPIAADQLPLTVAFRRRRPAHGWLTIASLDGVARRLEVMAFPVENAGRLLGAVALFWQVDAA
jgi:PAS domain-containing protein